MRRSVPLLAFALSCVALGANVSPWIKVAGGGWNPTDETLREVESALKSAVPAAAQNRGRLPDWSTYTFQYQGVSPIIGARYIRVNAFCDARDHHRNISARWVMVKDGGACFFSAKYDPKLQRVYDLSVNGVA
jgi:hypothetical protein